MLNVFCHEYTHIFIDNYPTTLFYHKMPMFGLNDYTAEGSGRGLNRKRGLAETNSYFIIKFDMFLIELKVYTTTCRSFFIFALV